MVILLMSWTLCLGSHAAGQEPPVYRTVLEESFDELGEGPFRPGANGWELLQQTDTSAIIAALAEGGRALRIIDNHVADNDATCRLRHGFGPVHGPCMVRLRMMMRQGEADGVNQDMGLHLFDGSRMLFDLFFSGGELKTWQGPTWTSLDPPVPWEEGRWYDIRLLVDPPAGTVEVIVDGKSHGTVELRGSSPGLSMIELTSQRYARGETWFDDIRIANAVPAELRTQASAAWEAASDRDRRRNWFADQGSAIENGALVVADGGLASMRRLVSVDMVRWPLLGLEMDAQGDVAYTLYARPTDDRAPEIVELRSSEFGRREHDVLALTAWQGEVTFELLFSARGKGRITVGEPDIGESPPNEYLADPASVWHFVKPSGEPSTLPDAVALQVTGQPADGPRTAHVSQGIPFPRGMLNETTRLGLKEAPLQTQVLSVWDDGSVRWLLVDADVALTPSGRATLSLTDGHTAEPEPQLAEGTDAAIRLKTAHFTLAIPRQSFGPMAGAPGVLNGVWDLVGRFAGRQFRASRGSYRTRIETNGPLRATVVISGTLSDGTDEPFLYELRVTAYRGSPDIELAPTFTLVTDEAEVQLDEMTLELGASPAAGPAIVGGEQPQAVERGAGQTVSLLQDQREHYVIRLGAEERASGTHAAGWLTAGDTTVAVRRFWQQFAKGLSVSDEGFRVELWSPEAAPRRFGRGAAKTHHVLVHVADDGATPDTVARRVADFEHPPTLYPGAEWYLQSLGMGHFPIPSEQHATMDALYERALNRRFEEQRRRADVSYGMVHYGDINHINSEIDAYKAFFMQGGRTGERKWLDFALDATLHSQDIDVCHYSPNPREVGIHHSHYPSDHNNGGLTLTHTWIEGQLFRYYLTGDRRSLMAADLAGRAFSRSMLTSGRMFDGGKEGGGIGSRAYGRACWALCELYRATHNPRYLWAMKRLTGYLIESLRDDGAVPASHDGAGRWNASDECPHMAAICAVGLARYADLTGDESVLAGLERIAKWQMSRGAMPEKLGIMYHNYQGGEVIHFIDACADMLEAWAFLYDATGNALYRDFAESVYDNMLEMSDRWVHDWTMGIRSMLLYLGRRDKWPERPAGSRSAPGAEAAVEWLLGCQNEDGGFGLVPGLPSDMDSTFRAVNALGLLGAKPRETESATNWVLSCRNEDGGFAGEPGWHSNVAWTWFALTAVDRLGAKLPAPERTVEWLRSAANEDGGNGSSPVAGELAYHGAWYSSCEYTSYKAQALRAVGAEPAESEAPAAFLRGLQVEGSGFKHRGGGPATAYTMDALDGLAALGAEPSDPGGCAAWVASLRRDDGGYGWPGAGRSTLRNTAHCVVALAHLGQPPEGAEAAATVGYALSCQHSSGGFGHAPGHSPTITATWHAVNTLERLNGLQF
jgi:prenyltransferase beta subunit